MVRRATLIGLLAVGNLNGVLLVGCGHPDYAAVHAPALVIDAVIDSVAQVFPTWTTLDPVRRDSVRRFTAALQAWAAAERARVRAELPAARVLELHGAHHYVFASHPAEVAQAMRAFLGADGGQASPAATPN